MSTLSAKAMLVGLTISQWTAKKLDKRATKTVEASHNTDSKIGNFNKKLLPGAKALDEIAATAQAIRQFYYDNTLPWCNDGTRVLSSKNYLNFLQEFRARKSVFDVQVAEFVAEYPELKADAQARLGDLFSESEYPTPEKVDKKFKCEVFFSPMPDVADFRVELTDDEKNRFVAQMNDVQKDAIREMWSRLHEVTVDAAQKLSDPEKIFRDSLIDKISKMCDLLGRMNITDDQDFEAMRQTVHDLANKIQPDLLRDNKDEREKAAKALQDCSDIMSSYMGAN